jgi:hypothetical protein
MTKPMARDPIYRRRVFDSDVLEKDDRAIKPRCASMSGFKSFANAAITLAGIELAHRIRKEHFSFGRDRRCRGRSRKAEWAMALAGTRGLRDTRSRQRTHMVRG